MTESSNLPQGLISEAVSPDLEEQVSHAGFWRRVGAFVIDTIVVAVPLLFLGMLIQDQPMIAGNPGRIIGFIPTILYFGLLNSEVFGGQTLGKRWLKIRVTDLTGRGISPGRSMIRSSILLVPFFLNGLEMRISQSSLPVIYVLGGVLFLGIGGLSFYFLFNFWNRRSLHDFLTGTQVVPVAIEATKSRIEPRTLHVFVAILLSGMAALGAYINLRVSSDEIMRRLETLQTSVMSSEAVRFAEPSMLSSSFNGKKSYSIVIILHPGDSGEDLERRLPEIYRKLSVDAPFIKEFDSLQFVVRTGFDFGMARLRYDKNFGRSIGEWNKTVEMLNKQSAKIP